MAEEKNSWFIQQTQLSADVQSGTTRCIAVLLLFIGTNAGDYSSDLLE